MLGSMVQCAAALYMARRTVNNAIVFGYRMKASARVVAGATELEAAVVACSLRRAACGLLAGLLLK
jgi:hypothetical protein